MHLARIVTALDIGRDARHGSRTVERNDCDQILDAVGLEPRQDVFHALTFKLEHALGISLGKQLVDLRVVDTDGVGVEIGVIAPYLRFRVVDGRQVGQRKEIHFEESQLLECRHGELCNHAALALGQRHIVGNGFLRDHHARGMDARLTRHALDAHGVVEQLADMAVLLIFDFQIRALLHGGPD